ncbi:MAG TPA: AmmeMemoRadiSam system protein B [Candidatus Aminicenantes bacterium]|nr:AmmeMemoRadiSam system protein B [Candidatus Aminicenantes bacterium]
MIRQPAVAGMFYPGDAVQLRRQVESMIPPAQSEVPVLGIVAPHAGYIYSGACAGRAWSGVIPKDTVVVLGVNHRGSGAPLAVDNHEAWRTPLGDVSVDLELAEMLAGEAPIFTLDDRAGLEEHSLEVQVPFIQVISPRVAILPIVVGAVDLETVLEAGRMLAGILFSRRPNLTLVASTDMSHYIRAEEAQRLDRRAIDRILALDPEGLFREVVGKRISMCGVAPTVMLLAAAREIGATRVEEVCYTHSGIVTGDDSEVVAYWSGRILR